MINKGVAECISGKCDKGYGRKDSDKTCASAFSYLFCFSSLICNLLVCAIVVQSMEPKAINLEAYA